MNCRDFEGAAGELAAGRLMDASQRENAIAHSASCAHCASRLADERALTDGLRFVAQTADEEAPAQVREALLEAFRGQISDSGGGVPMQTGRARWFYAAASAAAIAVIAALIAVMSSGPPKSLQPDREQATNPVPAAPGKARSTVPQQQVSRVGPATLVASQRRRAEERARNARRSTDSSGNIDRSANTDEIATDFIPLMNRETFAQMDGGQVMRVELPRSALMSFGLPMDMERATDRIKADVVVGNDGFARAIRFVR